MNLRVFKRPLWPLVGIVALALAIGVTGSLLDTQQLAAASRSEIKPALTTTTAAVDLKPTTFAPIVQKVVPSVVNIFSSRKVATDTRNFERFLDDPFFRRFLGDEFRQPLIPRERQERSLGSGVIVSSDGYIVTNNHVIDGGTDIKVSLRDNSEFPARVVGTDSKTDLAVLKIEKTGLPALPLDDASQVQIGGCRPRNREPVRRGTDRDDGHCKRDRTRRRHRRL